jgi:hypothetical protein
MEDEVEFNPVETNSTRRPVRSRLAVTSYVLSMAGPCLLVPWSITLQILINWSSRGPQDITGQAFLPLYLSPLGLLAGVIALVQIKSSRSLIQGKNYATAGIIIGALITFGLLILVAWMMALRSEGALASLVSGYA